MSGTIEQQLADLKASIDRNTEALLKVASGATAAPKASNKAPPAAADTPKVTQDEMNAALIKIKDDFGMEHAKAVITEHGKVAKMADIKPANYKAVYDAAIAKHAELSSGGGSSGDEGI